ncbi:MAG: hypothetical protein K2Q24_14985 [Chitinophagaceae bacterium]|jgi:hypothetical protein|nr:hypothetical protein [Chitinophagaceae bacterium]
MSTTTPERKGQYQLIPFLWLRRGIGFLGFVFPVVLVLGAWWLGGCNVILGSISDYYHTRMGDVFVGVICVIGLFLFTYRGPDKADSIASNLACIFAMGIAFFPTDIKELHETTSCLICKVDTFKFVHNIFAAAFFLVLTYFSLCLFTKTAKDDPPTAQKLKRNFVYKVCGYVMLSCIILIFVYWLFLKDLSILNNIPVIFIFEWIALWAFGISWIVKGGWFLEDKFKKN